MLLGLPCETARIVAFEEVLLPAFDLINWFSKGFMEGHLHSHHVMEEETVTFLSVTLAHKLQKQTNKNQETNKIYHWLLFEHHLS